KRSSGDGKFAWWELPQQATTTFYGSGRTGSIETTALAVLALLKSSQFPETTRAALAWLVQQKDARGTWHSPQATMLPLKARLAAGAADSGPRERRIEIAWGDGKRTVIIPANQFDVLQQLDLSELLTAGTHRVTLTESTGTATSYQLAYRHHVPGGRL